MPREAARWLTVQHPDWTVHHTSEVGLQRASDEEVAAWAIRERAILVTFDEDFLDTRRFRPGSRPATVRLRIWPITLTTIQEALNRVFTEVAEDVLTDSAVVVSDGRIRVRGR